jgi:hypothetical protein
MITKGAATITLERLPSCHICQKESLGSPVRGVGHQQALDIFWTRRLPGASLPHPMPAEQAGDEHVKRTAESQHILQEAREKARQKKK